MKGNFTYTAFKLSEVNKKYARYLTVLIRAFFFFFKHQLQCQDICKLNGEYNINA